MCICCMLSAEDDDIFGVYLNTRQMVMVHFIMSPVTLTSRRVLKNVTKHNMNILTLESRQIDFHQHWWSLNGVFTTIEVFDSRIIGQITLLYNNKQHNVTLCGRQRLVLVLVPSLLSVTLHS